MPGIKFSGPSDEVLILAEFVRIDDSIKDAILTIIRYVKTATGIEPSQLEIAAMLKSYFILNEIGNQVRYQLKKGAEKEHENPAAGQRPFWTLNLITGPSSNALARAGVFHSSIQEAIAAAKDFIKKTVGVEPSDDLLARSLKSSFILSEIKNQIDWQRKNARRVKDTDLSLEE
jgi:hypothetical protein